MSKSKEVSWTQRKRHEDRAEKKKKERSILEREYDMETKNISSYVDEYEEDNKEI